MDLSDLEYDESDFEDGPLYIDEALEEELKTQGIISPVKLSLTTKTTALEEVNHNINNNNNSHKRILDFDSEFINQEIKRQKIIAATAPNNNKNNRNVILEEFPDGNSIFDIGIDIDGEGDVVRDLRDELLISDEEEVEDIIPQVQYRRVLRTLPSIPYVPIINSDGSRVYLRLQKEKALLEEEADVQKLLINYKSNKTKKYSDDVFKIPIGKIENKENEDKENDKSIIKKDPEKIEENKIKLSIAENRLWVEKYKPNTYMELLSEENLNRNLLHWLKIWDKTVYGRDYLAKFKDSKAKFAKLDAKENEWEKNKIVVEDTDYDELGRPKQKVALLHGPPGLGKTTAAHIVAKCAGYKVVELNASDDRSLDIFKKIIDSTTGSRSEYFGENKPNCLIIDEIDGAPLPTVNYLVDYLSGKVTETGKGKNKSKKTLRRPIICICNDLFAPSLVNLRKCSFILQFHPISLPTIIDRLEDIVNKEKLDLDGMLIRALCEQSECDIRSCISTLQFLKHVKYRSKTKILGLLAKIGRNDKSKGIFNIWNDIFSRPTEWKKTSYYSDVDPNIPKERFKRILQIVQNFGDYEILSSGVYENYLLSKFRDSYFINIREGLDWLIWFEHLKNKIDTLQNYSMYGYLPLFFVQAHFLFANREPIKLQFPNLEKFSKPNRLRGVVETNLRMMCPSIGRMSNVNELFVEIYPQLLSIIQPCTIRSVPTQLWSAEEKSRIRKIVEIMLGYNLSYIQTRNAEGSYVYTMDPDLESLVKFSGQENSSNSRKQFAYTNKQLISKEIETEKLRKGDTSDNTTFTTTKTRENDQNQNSQEENDPNIQKPREKKFQSPTVNEWAKKAAAIRKIKEDDTPEQKKDIFGRVIYQSPNTIAQIEAKKIREASYVYFKYKNGYNNAVRKNIKLKDFL